MASHAARWTSLSAFLCLGGCLEGFAWDEVFDGPYRLVAVDILEDMSLCRSVGTTGDCVGDGLPGPTIFQAGWNSQYIVVACHPNGNRSITDFYYVVRQADERALKPVRVVGPLSERDYQQDKSRLRLPEFSRIFSKLK